MRVMRAIFRVFFFLLLVQDLAGHRSFRGRLSLNYMPLETARHPGRKCTGHERCRGWYLVSIQLITSFNLFSGKLENPNKIIRFNTSIVRMKMNLCEESRRR